MWVQKKKKDYYVFVRGHNHSPGQRGFCLKALLFLFLIKEINEQRLFVHNNNNCHRHYNCLGTKRKSTQMNVKQM